MPENTENPFAAPSSDLLDAPIITAARQKPFRIGDRVTVCPDLLSGAPVTMVVTGRRPLGGDFGGFELTATWLLRVPTDLAGAGPWDVQVRAVSLPETAFLHVAQEAQK